MAKRWMAEIAYRTERPGETVTFEELAELHDIVERGPDWNEIDQITITLNRPSVERKPDEPLPRKSMPWRNAQS